MPLVGEPSAAAIAAIEKCTAIAGDIGARVTAMVVEQDISVRPKVAISSDLENMVATKAVRSVDGVRYCGHSLWRTQRAMASAVCPGGYSGEFGGMGAAEGSVAPPSQAA